MCGEKSVADAALASGSVVKGERRGAPQSDGTVAMYLCSLMLEDAVMSEAKVGRDTTLCNDAPRK
jgi:hypothetical protein